MSDQRTWLDDCCPQCEAPPGARCQGRRLFRKHPAQLSFLHVARGWRQRPCPTCKAQPREPCHTPSGREATRPHTARLHPGSGELTGRGRVWDQLAQRSATAALVSFLGRDGHSGQTATISLRGRERDQLGDVERWTIGRDELCHALEAPIWGRYGTFTGHPYIHGTVIWLTDQHRIVIRGQRGALPFEETIT